MYNIYTAFGVNAAGKWEAPLSHAFPLLRSDTCHVLCHGIAMLLGSVRWLHPGAGSTAEFSWGSKSLFETHFMLRLVSSKSSVASGVCVPSLAYPVSHRLQSIAVSHVEGVAVLAASPLLVLPHVLLHNPSQRSSKQRVTHPACRHHLLQSFKLRC